jgi:APA family basic amino acid/polyamine antiporter
VAAVIVLRWKMPQAERPYRVWFYPVTPILYLVVAVLVVGSMVLAAFAEEPSPADLYQVPAVIGLMVVGLILYWVFRQLEQFPRSGATGK